MAKKIVNTKEINKLLRQKLGTGKKVRIGKADNEATWLKGNDAIAVGIEQKGEVVIYGKAGDFFGALNKGGNLVLRGEVRGFVGDSMEGGEIVVVGNAGKGAGYCMRNGRLLIRGKAGPFAGMLLQGGVIVIDGDAGDLAGTAMRDGTLVVTGSVGKDTGLSMAGGRILAHAPQTALRDQEEDRGLREDNHCRRGGRGDGVR